MTLRNPEGGWQSLADLDSAEGPGRFLGRMIRNFKVPAAQAAELATAAEELKKEGDVYAGDLTEEFEFKVTGKVDFNGNEFDVDRTSTVEVKEVGATKVNPNVA